MKMIPIKMDQRPIKIENKDAPALVEEDVSEKSFMKLIDTLLLTVMNVTSGTGSISKTLNDTGILEFIIEMPVINTNVIIQYDLKLKEQPVNKSFHLENTPESILDIKKEPGEYHSENEHYCENGGEFQVIPYDNSRPVVDNNINYYYYDKMIIPYHENLNNHEEDHIIPISNVASDISEDSIYSGSDIKNFSCSDYVATDEKSSTSKESSVCEKSFSILSHKNRHEVNHSCERPFSSEVCGKSFYSTFDLKRREKIHKGEKPHSCSVCGKSFISMSLKTTHERIHSGERPYSCSLCGKSFSIAYNKKRHERIHTGEKPYPCSICGKSFINKSAKDAHERIHSQESPYSCTVCGKSFKSQSSKVAHEKIHTGEKPFSCSVCGRRFLRDKDKMIHERTHTNEKPYPCSFCEKSFSTSSNKSAHERIHTGERPYACAICGKSFTTGNTKNRHERTHRSGKHLHSSEKT